MSEIRGYKQATPTGFGSRPVLKMVSFGGILVMLLLWGGVWVFWRWPDNFVLGVFLLLPVIAGIGFYGFARWHRASANPGGYARVYRATKLSGPRRRCR